jgi:preprotein translocase subunit SecG
MKLLYNVRRVLWLSVFLIYAILIHPTARAESLSTGVKGKFESESESYTGLPNILTRNSSSNSVHQG